LLRFCYELRKAALILIRGLGSVALGEVGMLQLNVYAKRLIEFFTGFSMSARSIGHGLFDADDLMALRALAETMTGAIHFAPWPKPTRVDQFRFFHILSFLRLRPDYYAS